MRLPEIRSKQTQIQMIDSFGGYNHNLQIGDQEFYEMENMTSDYLPVMGNRPKRVIVDTLVNPMGMIGHDKIYYIDDDELYYNGSKILDLDTLTVERTMLMMGAYLVIFPDKVMYNTETKELSELENSVTTKTAPTFTLCRMDGTKYDDAETYTGDDEPDKDVYKYWIDTSQDTVVMKVWIETTAQWTSVGTTYVKIESKDIGKGFKKEDAVELSGVDTDREEIYNNYDFNTTNILFDCGDDYLVVVGLINKHFTNRRYIQAKRVLPKLDYVCEYNNRLWGCSSEDHEIYCSKLGDPKNWRSYRGIASDSFAATVGTAGDFTGCIAYNGTVLFFKEEGVHKLYGTDPQNFQIDWYPMRGVQKGSEKSMVVLNEFLFYKSRDAICAYDGSQPAAISDVFGDKMYYDAVAGRYGDKYIVSLKRKETREEHEKDPRTKKVYNHVYPQDVDMEEVWYPGEWHPKCRESYEYEHDRFETYAYDTRERVWMKEDDVRINWFGMTDGACWIINGDNQLQAISKEIIYWSVFPQDVSMENVWYPGAWYPNCKMVETVENIINWSITTGDLGMDIPNEKFVTGFVIRMELAYDAMAKIEVEYDKDLNWREVVKIFGAKKRSYDLPIPVVRHDYMRLRISGHGEVRLYSITKKLQEGSLHR